MKGFLIAVIALVVVAAGWMLFTGNQASNNEAYVVSVPSEVVALEEELEAIAVEVDSGTLTPEAAAAAQERIVNRLNQIAASVEADVNAALTPAQREQLDAGLERLKVVLTNYQSTLLAVDETVLELPEAARPVLRRGGNAVRNLATAVMETTEVVQVEAAAVLDSYIIESAEELFEALASTTQAMLEVETIEQATSTEDMMEGDSDTDSSTSTDEVEEMVDMDETESPVQEFTVDSFNFGYSMEEIRVKQGDTVTINLTNSDGFHDWVVDEFNAATEKIRAGETTSVTFVADQAGTFEFYCSVGSHRAQGMVGVLVVE